MDLKRIESAVREILIAIGEDPKGWKKAAQGKSFTDRFALSGDSLKRLPPRFDANHPYADDLKRKDFIGIAHVDVADQWNCSQACFGFDLCSSSFDVLSTNSSSCSDLYQTDLAGTGVLQSAAPRFERHLFHPAEAQDDG